MAMGDCFRDGSQPSRATLKPTPQVDWAGRRDSGGGGMFRLVKDKVKVLGQKRNDGLEARKKKNEDIVKIAFTPDRDLDDYLRSKNLLDEKEIKVKG